MWVSTLWLYIAVSLKPWSSFLCIFGHTLIEPLGIFLQTECSFGGLQTPRQYWLQVCITTCLVLYKMGWHKPQSAKKLSSFFKHHTKEDMSVSCSCWWELLPLVQVKLSAFSSPQSYSVLQIWFSAVLNHITAKSLGFELATDSIQFYLFVNLARHSLSVIQYFQ